MAAIAATAGANRVRRIGAPSVSEKGTGTRCALPARCERRSLLVCPLPTLPAAFRSCRSPTSGARSSSMWMCSISRWDSTPASTAGCGARRDRDSLLGGRTTPICRRCRVCRIEVTEIRQLYSHCREKGVVDPSSDIAAQTWGTTEFVALDPDGNRLTFVESVWARVVGQGCSRLSAQAYSALLGRVRARLAKL